MSACLREREKRGWWTRSEEDKRAKGQDQRGGGGSRKATASGVLGLGLSPVWCVCGISCVCEWTVW